MVYWRYIGSRAEALLHGLQTSLRGLGSPDPAFEALNFSFLTPWQLHVSLLSTALLLQLCAHAPVRAPLAPL